MASTSREPLQKLSQPRVKLSDDLLVLLICGDRKEQDILVAEIELIGFRDHVRAVAGPQEALAQVLKRRPTLVVYRWCEADDLSLCRSLCSEYDLSMLVLGPETVAAQLGTDLFLPAPYVIQDLIHNLYSLLFPEGWEQQLPRIDPARLTDEGQRYRDLFERASDAILLVDFDTHSILDVNERAVEMYKYTRDELIGMNLLQMVPREQHVSLWQNTRSMMESGSAMTITERIHLRKDGVTIPVSISASLIEYGGRKIFQDIIRDEIERLRAEKALRESEARLHQLADSMPQLVWMADAQGQIFWYNQRWYDYTGTTLAEMKGWGWQKVHHPAHVDRVVTHIKQSFEMGEPWEDTFPLRNKVGEYRWFLSRALPIRDEQGRVVRWFGTNTDITENLRLEQELREREHRLSLATEIAGLGVFEWDLQTEQAVWENERMYEIHRRSGSDGTPTMADFMDSVHPEDLAVFAGVLAEGMKSGERWHTTLRLRRADGELIWVELNGQAHLSDDGTPLRITGVMADVSQRKQAEAERERLLAQLAQERAQLQQLAETLEARVTERTAEIRTLATQLSLVEHAERQRIAHILHDHIQQLLYGVQWQTYVVEADLPAEISDAVRGHFIKMNELITEAVQASRTLAVELNPPVLEKEEFPAAIAWLADQMRELHALNVITEMHGDCNIEKNKSLKILVFQVIRELLFNIVKHAQVQRAYLTMRQEAEQLVVIVRDNGVGFDQTTVSSKDDRLTGFGLSSIYERLRLFDGRIEVDSKLGTGTQVTIVFPTPK